MLNEKAMLPDEDETGFTGNDVAQEEPASTTEEAIQPEENGDDDTADQD